jgi:hypothetical protein
MIYLMREWKAGESHKDLVQIWSLVGIGAVCKREGSMSTITPGTRGNTETEELKGVPDRVVIPHSINLSP